MSILHQSKQFISLTVTWDIASFTSTAPWNQTGAVQTPGLSPQGESTADTKSFAIESNFSWRNTLVVLLQVCCLNDRMHPAIAQSPGLPLQALGGLKKSIARGALLEQGRMAWRGATHVLAVSLCSSKCHRCHSPGAFLKIYLDANVWLLSND